MPLTSRYTLNDLRRARETGAKIGFLTCYDYTTARVMQEAGVPALLVGDSAGSVVLGYESTVPVKLDFLIELTAGVRRGAPLAFLLADMPFGSYQQSDAQGARNVFRMVQETSCDAVKLEVAWNHDKLVRRLADAGVVVVAHIGLRPQTVALLGGYKFQGRTSREATEIVLLARRMELAGAAALLLEAVPPEVSEAVIKRVQIPVIGCGAGPACHAHVFVTPDALGFSAKTPRFVPQLGDVATPLRTAVSDYLQLISSGRYPAPEQQYEMPAAEKEQFLHTMSKMR